MSCFRFHRDLPGGSVVKTLYSNARVTGSSPGWETKIPMPHGLALKKEIDSTYKLHYMVSVFLFLTYFT